TRDEDFVENLFVASTHSYILIFSDKGRVYWLKVHEIPQAGRAARGKPIVNLVQLSQGEKVAAILPVRELSAQAGAGGADPLDGEGEGDGVEAAPAAVAGTFVIAATRRGLVKKTPLAAYARPRPSGIIALSIEEGDSLIAARITDGQGHILLSTAHGIAIRFEESEVRPTGRSAYGVKGITLEKGDEVVSAESLPPTQEGAIAATILSVTANGYGKRTGLSEYRIQMRGGRGIITIKATERNGAVVAALPVVEADEVMLITNRGMLIRMPAGQISLIGRNTQGVRLISLESREEQVAGVARVAENVTVSDENGEVGNGEAENGEAAGEAGSGGDGSPEGEPA
ncbi:MAG: DNA gyrase subunit A, partial [Deltaproteobacteria bacterium]|nr:DNA gyrase subunit A [Deltaproteobacteria bacterium]